MAIESHRSEGRRSLQVNLVLPAGIVLIAVLAVSFFAFNSILKTRGSESLQAKSKSVAEMAARSMAEGVEFKDREVLQPMVDGIFEDPDVKAAYVHSENGEVLVSHVREGATDTRTLPNIANIAKEEPTVTASEVTVLRPIRSKTEVVGAIRLIYSRDAALADIRRASTWYAAIAALLVLIGLAVLWVTIGNAVRPVVALTEATSRIVSAGDLTQRIPVGSRDEIGQLGEMFNQMLDRLRQVPTSLQGSVTDLGSAVAGLTELTRAQTASVQRQAAGLSEASATTQEIKQTSAVAAAKAETVLEVANKAEAFSGAGQTAVEESIQGLQDIRAQIEAIVGRIGELSERTLQVGEIIETVKDLADQSNVLALNAAIEAAMAGEFGRGFGVVAREIRSLADQSIQSTGRIREILSEIQGAIRSTVAITEEGKRRMEQSMEQIRASGENMREMAAVVHESSKAARQIAASVNQQNVGITQISAAIGSLDAAMEETSKGIRGAETAVENLKSVSGRISEIVRGFRV